MPRLCVHGVQYLKKEETAVNMMYMAVVFEPSASCGVEDAGFLFQDNLRYRAFDW